ncbi:MAG: M48 family metalloprotease [Rubrivivax sp.]|nr:M48 family metalloprotease [Rubrivivax sp.]
MKSLFRWAWCTRAPATVALTLAAVLALASLRLEPAQAQVRLPEMGETVSASMPLGAERRLGEQIWQEVRRDPAWFDDPVLTDYLHRHWWPLVAAAERRGEIDAEMRQQFAWDAFLIRDRSINAFALPGGFVGMHLGLIAATTAREEMVSVLAHELSHVTQRHIARSIESSGRQTALGVAAMLLGVIAASRSGNPDIANAAIAGGQAAMIQGQLNFSRDMEREADRVGQALMVDAGFSATGMPSMFDKLDKAYRLNDAGNFPYLRSHPLTVERIAEAQARAGIDRTVRLAGDEEHELMRARARVLMDPSVAHLRSILAAPGSQPADKPLAASAAYAAALAAVLLKDGAATRAALVRLDSVSRSPAERRWAGLMQAEAALALPTELPLPSPASAGSADGWARPDVLIWGRVLLAREATGAAAGDGALRNLHQSLRTRVVREPRDAALWELLAACETLRDNRLAALRATAESYLWSGRPDAAILTLQSARSGARQWREADTVELAVIDARLNELRRQRAQQRQARGERGPREE